MYLNPINSFKNLEALVFLLHVVFPPFLQCCFSHVTLKSHFNIERGRGGKCMSACFMDFWRGLADWARFALKALNIQIHYSVIEPASLSLWSFVFLGLNHQFPSEFTFYALDPWYFFQEMLNTLILISCFVFNSLPGLSVHADYHTLINDDFWSCAGLILKTDRRGLPVKLRNGLSLGSTNLSVEKSITR